MNKAIFFAFVIFVIELVLTIHASDTNQSVGQKNDNKASAESGVKNDNAQKGTVKA